MATTRSRRSATSTPIWGRRQATPSRRFARPIPAARGRRASQSRFGTPTALRFRHTKPKTGFAGLMQRASTGARSAAARQRRSKKGTAMAMIAGLGAGAAALMGRKRAGHHSEPQTYAPPAEPSMPQTPAGVGGDGSSTP